MTARTVWRGRHALAAIAATAALAITVVAFTLPGRSAGRAFPTLHPAAAPAGWPHLTLPNRSAVLSYPPALRPIPGDTGAVSVAMRSSAGAYLLYLNATPRQGTETLRNWATFRVHLLREDDASTAHLDAAATGLTFRGGTGSCVIDDYVTKIGAHHYREIACLVQGQAAASVVVGTAPAPRWSQARPLLERAVAAYRIR